MIFLRPFFLSLILLLAISVDVAAKSSRECIKLSSAFILEFKKRPYGIEIETAVGPAHISKRLYDNVSKDVAAFLNDTVPDIKAEVMMAELSFTFIDESGANSARLHIVDSRVVSEFLIPSSIPESFYKAEVALKKIAAKGKFTSGNMKNFAFKHSARVSNDYLYFNRVKYQFKGKTYMIEFTHDSTVSMVENGSLEIISPVLGRAEGDEAIFAKIVDRVVSKYSLELNQATGQHTHVEFSDQPLKKKILSGDYPLISKDEGKKLEILLDVFQKLYPELRKANSRESIDQYAAEPDYKRMRGFIKELQKNGELNSNHLMKNKYSAFNLMSLFKHGTVEIRIFDSTLDPSVAINNSRFWQFLVDGIQGDNKELINYIYSSSEVSVQGIIDLLNIPVMK